MVRVLAEIGDDRPRFTDARALKAYAGSVPVTRARARRAPSNGVVFKSRTDASVVNLIVSLAEKTSLAKARPIAATVALPSMRTTASVKTISASWRPSPQIPRNG